MTPLKKTLLILIVTAFSFGISAQVADSVYYERLYYTCKAWGHAKYYHSRIAAGVVNWDDVLLNALPDIKNAPDNQAFNNALLSMLQQAGESERGTEPLPEIPDSLNNNLDLSWIYHPIFSDQVSELLDTIMQRFTPRPNVYIKSYPAGNPNFEKDDKYSGIQYPDEDKRNLAVFRYWNIIHYFFPYKYIMDQDWDSTLAQAIPAIVKALNVLEYHLAMREFTSKINDSHAFFYSSPYKSWKGLYYTPFLARLIEEEVVITKVISSVSGLYPGDIIKKIDGFEINHLKDSLRKYSFGSNQISIETNLIDIILSGKAGNFSLTVVNETGEHTQNLSRENYYSILLQDNTPEWRVIILNGCKFGVVNMEKLYYYHFPEIIDKFRSVDAIIFDIRNYPNGTLWTLAQYMFNTSIHIANFTCSDINYPGRLFWDVEVIGQANPNPPQKKVMILFDERTLSQAEYTCMGLEQIPDAIKIGSTTAAADGNVSNIFLPGGITAMATFLGTYYPDYTPTQRIGIIPDYTVLPTIQGIREGRDEVLEFALNCEFVGIEHIAIRDGISVYPNPTTGELSVASYQLSVESVEVFDIYGKKISSHHLIPSSSNHRINIAHLPQGIYIVKITANGQVYTRKVVKIK